LQLLKTINSRPVCQPILSLVESFVKNGCIIEKQVLEDHHFDEMLFVLKAPEKFKFDNIILPNGIEQSKSNVFTCNCHWSTVEILI
jgi:hypothetical protein